MNSKERTCIAMSGGTPDRVPVMPQICPPHAIRVAGLPFKETVVDQLRNPRKYDLLVADCAHRYGVDGFRVWMGEEPVSVEWEGDDAFQVEPQTGEKIGTVDFMGGGGVVLLPELQRQLTEEDIEAIPVIPAEELLDDEVLVPTKKVVEKYGRDMFIVGCPGSFIYEVVFGLQGSKTTIMDLAVRPDFVKRMTERQMAASLQRAIAMVKLGVDAIYIGATFGQLMSPPQFAELYLPYLKRFIAEMRPYGALLYLHMCGRITHLLDLIATAGADCLEPLDELAGTAVREVRERLGDRIALMGGVNTVLLSQGTVEEVREDCVRCIREGGADGGYILAACDMLPTETDSEKVKAMLECAKEVGRYDCG